MRATSVCASDLSYVGFGSTNILGHELAGIRSDGTPVVVEAIYGCMECEQCRAGCLQPLPDTRAARPGHRGRRRHGRHVPCALGAAGAGAGRPRPAATPASWNRPRSRGTLSGWPAPVPVHGLRSSGPGALGLLAVAGARHMGAEDVALDARHAHQRAAGERLGARVGAEGTYDVVVEAAVAREPGAVRPAGGAGRDHRRARRPLRPGAARLDAPVPPRGQAHPLAWLLAHNGLREMEEAAAMLAVDPDIAATIITHRFPLDDAVEAFRVASDRSSGASPRRHRARLGGGAQLALEHLARRVARQGIQEGDVLRDLEPASCPAQCASS